MDEIVRTNPREFQRISARIIYTVNPDREKILDSRELTRRILEHSQKERTDRKILNYLKNGPKLLFEAAQEGELWAQKLLGWIRPWQKRIVHVRGPVENWKLRGLEILIKEHEEAIAEHERAIFYIRHLMWQAGGRLRPLKTPRLRRLERQYLMKMGWTEEAQMRSEHFW